MQLTLARWQVLQGKAYAVCLLVFSRLECTPAGAQVNLPEPGQSFAFIYSVEDPGSTSRNTGMAAQVRLATCRRWGLT